MGVSMSNVELHLAQCGYSRRDITNFKRRFESCPEVWREFEGMALRLIADGKKAGAIDIIARIRWERVVEQRLDFKCNNTDAPYYARIFALKHPEHNHFFEFRKVS
jgi:hypothetical protein